jgi:hypothetical protein
VIGIQVFQHGRRASAHDRIRAAHARLAPGGLFCLRVNALGTELEYDHDVVKRDGDDSFTVPLPRRSQAGAPHPLLR